MKKPLLISAKAHKLLSELKNKLGLRGLGDAIYFLSCYYVFQIKRNKLNAYQLEKLIKNQIKEEEEKETKAS